MYDFTKFEGRNARLEDRITITKSNSIGFPTRFCEKNNIKSYKYVVLFWDKKNQAIGLHFINDELEKNKFSITFSDRYGGNIVARSFFRAHGLDPQKYHGKYDWKKENVDGIGEIYVVDLKTKSASE